MMQDLREPEVIHILQWHEKPISPCLNCNHNDQFAKCSNPHKTHTFSSTERHDADQDKKRAKPKEENSSVPGWFVKNSEDRFCQKPFPFFVPSLTDGYFSQAQLVMIRTPSGRSGILDQKFNQWRDVRWEFLFQCPS